MKNLQDPPQSALGAWKFGFLALLLLLSGLLMRFSSVAVWDDAWFYARYAEHLLQHGEFQWNLGARAYGLTAPFYGLQVLFGQLLGLPAGFTLWLLAFSWGWAGLLLLLRVVLRHADDTGVNRRWLRDFVLLVFAMNALGLASHMSSGMDTTCAMAYMSFYIMLLRAYAPRLSPGRAMMLGVVGGLAWTLRPELMIFSLGLPVGLIVFAKKPLQRREAAYALLFTCAMTLVQAWMALREFGTLLPLSFYAKSLGLYGPSIVAEYRGVGWGYLGLFLLMNLLPLACIAGAAWAGRRVWWKFLAVHERLLLVGALAFMLYQLAFVLPVMGYEARLYYPVWPIWVWLGARSFVFLLRVRPQIREQLTRWSGRTWAWGGISALIAVVGIWALLHTRPAGSRASWADFSLAAAHDAHGRLNWPYLDQLAALPDSFSIASTELGILGMYRLGCPVIDLSGLHDSQLAQEGFDPARLLQKQHPDWIYMPQAVYAEMHESMVQHPAFVRNYELIRLEDAYHDIALRRDSPWYPQMQALAAKDDL